MNYYNTLKHIIDKKAIGKRVICLADPISKWIKSEVRDLKEEDFYETMVGVHQLKIIEEDGERVLIIMLSKFQLKEVYPDIMERLIETRYAVKPEMEFKLFNKSVATSEPVGYCHLQTHPGHISKSLLDQHQCLGKQCPFLERYASHCYWWQREIAKQKRKDRKTRFS
ncbi:MAG: hypothetical protein IKY23_09755 [Lachnospiraceae bacterium]|nr:hypothetical protein [Lachnospiraceae bacterium]